MQTREETQQVANTHVQHVVNTVEVEMPKIRRQCMERNPSHPREDQPDDAEPGPLEPECSGDHGGTPVAIP